MRAPGRVVLDLDDSDCYLPLYIFCGRHLLASQLRRSNIDAAAGAADEVARIVGGLRERWPGVEVLLRGDSGFAREELMAWCEDNGVEYLFGLARIDREMLHAECWRYSPVIGTPRLSITAFRPHSAPRP